MTRARAAAIGLDVFYPIVPDIGWLERLLPIGIRTVQIRIKDTGMDDVRAQIAKAIPLCAAAGCQLIVNDYWEAAIELGANFIHLGQEDLADADVARIKAAGYGVAAFTINNVAHARTLIGWGVDSIITDSPDVMLPALS